MGGAVAANPRLCPQTARNSDDYARLYATRATTERSHSMKKQKFKLLQARRRGRSGWLNTLVSIAILQHARVWAMRDQAARGKIEASLRREAERGDPNG